ncbi:MAG: glycosyltransferase family 4 protein [Pseudomonadota bacterium]
MNLLFIHQNFPGQFRHIAQHFARDPKHRVLAIGRDTCPGMPGINLVKYARHRGSAKETHHYVKTFEDGVIHGQGVVRLLLQLQKKGFVPDVVVGHPGWGETLYVKEVFPHCRLVHLCEFYYHTDGADCGFDPEFPNSMDDRARIRSRNGLHLLNLEQCDAGIAPTEWQRSLFPTAYQPKIRTIHEGINTQVLLPDAQATFQLPATPALPEGKLLRAGDPVVTYVSRNLEPYRGFHSFMRAVPAMLEASPCDIVIVGGDGVSYGSKPRDAANWRERMLKEVKVDPARVHFLGQIPYAQYCRLLQVSAAHVYLTYPFVLSWSMLEAMASGCLIVGSDTAPVREVVKHGHNGLLVDFFDHKAIAATVADALARPREMQELRRRASVEVRRDYSFERGLKGYQDVIGVGGHVS